jgi:hypothetical protein
MVSVAQQAGRKGARGSHLDSVHAVQGPGWHIKHSTCVQMQPDCSRQCSCQVAEVVGVEASASAFLRELADRGEQGAAVLARQRQDLGHEVGDLHWMLCLHGMRTACQGGRGRVDKAKGGMVNVAKLEAKVLPLGTRRGDGRGAL